MSNATRHRLKGILWITLAGCFVSSHAAQTAGSPPPASRHPSQKQIVTAAASSLTAEDIGRRVLKLVDTIHTVDDISPAHIEKVVGVKVEFNAKDPNDYGFGGKLTNEWSYGFGSLTDAPSVKPTRLMLSFDDQTRKDADIAPICGFDMDGYKKILTDAGFSASPYCGEHGRHLDWNLSRDKVSVTLTAKAKKTAKLHAIAYRCLNSKLPTPRGTDHAASSVYGCGDGHTQSGFGYTRYCAQECRDARRAVPNQAPKHRKRKT